MMQKTYQKNDLRVKRTEKLIFDSLIALTIQKGFSVVTVSDITEFAGINRATFYRHYKDKFDLVNKYAQSVSEMLDSSLQKSDSHQIQPSLIKIIEHIRENASFYRVMWGKNGDPDFSEKIRAYIQKRIRASLPTNLKIDEQRLELFVNYSAYASFGAVIWWLEHDMPYSSEEMVNILFQLESGNLNNTMCPKQ